MLYIHKYILYYQEVGDNPDVEQSFKAVMSSNSMISSLYVYDREKKLKLRVKGNESGEVFDSMVREFNVVDGLDLVRRN